VELIEDVALYLEGQSGMGVVYRQGFPQEPVSAISVMTIGGTNPPGDPVTRPSFQVSVRRTSKREGLAKATEIHGLLHNKWSDAGGTVLQERLGRILAEMVPGNFYTDESDNFIFTVNFYMVLAPGSPGGS